MLRCGFHPPEFENIAKNVVALAEDDVENDTIAEVEDDATTEVEETTPDEEVVEDTDDTYPTDTELVNGEVPTPAKDFKFDSKTGTITDYIGSDSEIVIPRTINGVPVRVLGGDITGSTTTTSFTTCKNYVTKVTVPNTVITINNGFRGLKAVDEVVFEKGSQLSNIEEAAFQNTAIRKIVLPDSLKTIDQLAFAGCTSLDEIVIPDTVTTLPYRTFYGCTGLKKVTFGENVTSIGQEAFNGCTALVNPDFVNVDSIASGAFKGCTSINDLDFGNVKTIGDNAFYGCSFKYLTLTDGMYIGDYAFAYCNNLVNLTTVGAVSIGELSFYMCTGLRKSTISKETTLGSRCIGEYQYINAVSTDFIIYGYTGSPAQEYAERYDTVFIPLDSATIGDSTATETTTGDVNGDGEIDSVDLLMLKKYILGIIDTLA